MFKQLTKSGSIILISTLATYTTTHAAEFEIQTGTFFMAGVTGAPIALVGGSNTGTLVEGTYQGVTPTGPYPNAPVNTAVANNEALFSPFPFFGQNVGTYTAETGVDGVTHPAPTIDIAGGTANLSAFYAYWNGTEFNQGNSSVPVNDNGDGTYTLSWDSLIVGGPFDSFTGSWTMDVVVAGIDTIAGPTTTLTVNQSSLTTNGTVSKTDGLFNIASSFTDATYTFDWSLTDTAILAAGTPGVGGITNIDPSGLDAGNYTITLLLSKAVNATTEEKSRADFALTIVETGEAADFVDTDGDGIPDSSDGIDNVATPTLQPTEEGNSSTYLMESSAGLLTIGSTATCISSATVTVTLDDITNYAGASCTAVSNAIDNVNQVTTGIGGYFDFVVRNLTAGDQIDIIIPLTTVLPKNAGYRKYTRTAGWQPFDTTGEDSVASASGDAGTCPAADSTEWTTGLTEGDNCVRLSITDGGENDADGQANGTIVDPGTFSGYAGIEDSANISIGGGWWFLMGLPALVGLRRYTAKQ